MTSFQNLNIPNPDVSVIIPTYNRVSMLEEALASVFSQEFDGVVEVIVVDDNSQDGTSEIVGRKYPNVRLISLKQNVGPSAARNRAILEAKGKYIAFLDSDDLWESNYLKVQVAALESAEKSFCVSNLSIWYTVENLKVVLVQKPDLKKYISPIHHLLVSNFIKTLSSVVIPRQAFDEVGLFDEKLIIGEDADLYIRCILSGYNIIFAEITGVIKREHAQEQLTKNLKLMEKCRFMRVEKFYSLAEGRFDLVPPRQRIYAENYEAFGKQYFKNKNVLNWITLHINAAFNISPKYAVSNMIRDIRNLLKLGTNLSKIHYYIKNLFHQAN